MVNPGDLVFIRYINRSKLFHPMHLHGHTFQIMLRKSNDPQEPVFVAPHRTVDIDIETGNPGRWITHCHNIVSSVIGMTNVIEYAVLDVLSD